MVFISNLTFLLLPTLIKVLSFRQVDCACVYYSLTNGVFRLDSILLVCNIGHINNLIIQHYLYEKLILIPTFITRFLVKYTVKWLLMYVYMLHTVNCSHKGESTVFIVLPLRCTCGHVMALKYGCNGFYQYFSLIYRQCNLQFSILWKQKQKANNNGKTGSEIAGNFKHLILFFLKWHSVLMQNLKTRV